MQWNFKIISAICVAFAALTGCNDSIDEDIAPRQLVVEGYIDSDGYPCRYVGLWRGADQQYYRRHTYSYVCRNLYDYLNEAVVAA